VSENAADAQKQISKNLETIRSNIIGAAEKRIRTAADAIIEDRTAKKPKGDHGLAEALALLDAQIKSQNALAAAYQISDVAAIKAEALQKAEEEAIRHKGQVGIFYEKELALAVAKGAADSAKVIADIHAEAAARSVVNDLVAQGIIPAQRMSQALEEQQKKRDLLARIAIADEQGWAKQAADLRVELARLAHDQGVLNDELATEAALRQIATNKDQLDQLKLEATLIGATNEARAVAIAQLQAQQYIRDNAIKDPQQQADVTKSYVDAAIAATDLATKQDLYNQSLSYTADLLQLMNERAQTVASTLSDAFGNVGSGLGQAITALSNYSAQQAKLDQAHRAAIKAGLSDEKEVDLYRKASLNNQLAGTAQLIGGLKTMFKEHSTGYRAMEAAERAFAIIQAINTIKNVAAGAAKMFATLGPFAFPAVAAMIAVMAALGFSGGGNSTQKAPTSPEDLQKAAGTGTVLGSPKDKSASIANSLEIIAKNSNTDLEYSNSMLKALRSIDNSIGAMATVVAQQISATGSAFDTLSLKLGTNTSGGLGTILGTGLGIPLGGALAAALGIFGPLGFIAGGLIGNVIGGLLGGKKTVTTSLYDQGIDLGPQSVGSIVNGAVQGSIYDVIEKVTKKKGALFGLIGGSTKTTYDTVNSALPSDINDAIKSVIGALENGLVAAANVVGIDGAKAMLDGFQINIGKISLKDLDAKGIQDQFNAIFSSISDQMAKAVFPALTSMQKVGEGLFETFVRVAKEYETVDIELRSIGRTFGTIGVNSITARDALVQLFGGLDQFVSATDAFRDKFLTDAEQIAPVQQAVVAEMVRLGVANVTTREQFKNLVLGLDLTTDAGRQMYASLLAVAPAFDKVQSYFDNLNKTSTEALKSTVDQFGKFADSLKKYRDTLFSTGASQSATLELTRRQFQATATLAATGDATALGNLQSNAQAYLDSARANAHTMLEYQRAVSQVAAGVDKGIFAAESTADYAQLQLDALQNATGILQAINANTAAAVDALLHPPPVPVPATAPAPTTAPTNPVTADDLAEIQTALEAVAVNTGGILRKLARWDGGDGMLTTTL
jgi:hypothetical protein